MSWRLLRSSGGLIYHFKALRYKAKLWRSFTLAVEQELEKWPKRSNQILIFGCSGGYTLGSTWLKRYESVIGVDADPLAGLIFRANHPSVSFHFEHQSLFDAQFEKSLERFQRLLEKYPESDVLFSNLLGQLMIDLPVSARPSESTWLVFLSQLRMKLSQRNWASYHDLWSQTGSERTDHLMTGKWSEGLSKKTLTWQITPKQMHQIEIVY